MRYCFSIDLRTRVMAAVDSGMQIDAVAKAFTVSRRVIYEWKALRKSTGSLAAKTDFYKGHSHKITDWDKFREFANANKLCTGPQLVAKWKDLTGVGMSDTVMYEALKKIGFTSKKKRSVIPKLMQKNKENL